MLVSSEHLIITGHINYEEQTVVEHRRAFGLISSQEKCSKNCRLCPHDSE
jgi:hypothetical protein